MLVTKKCKVCGKEFEACDTPPSAGVYNWRAVCCSPACGTIDLRRQLASRQAPADAPAEAKKRQRKPRGEAEAGQDAAETEAISSDP